MNLNPGTFNDKMASPNPICHVLTFGERGTEPGQFHIPIDIAIDHADNIFISDFYNHRIQKFDTSGELMDVYSTQQHPGGMGVDQYGKIFLSHFSYREADVLVEEDSITVHDNSGRRLHRWGSYGTEPGQFSCPGGITIGQNDLIYVADQTNHRIQVFDKSGRWVNGWGEYGLEPGQFGGNCNPESRVGGPQFVAIDGQGHVYTTEGMVGRIQKFTAGGEYLLSWGDNEDQTGSFGRPFAAMQIYLVGPIGIVADPNEGVWVSSVGGRIQHFNAQGVFLRGFGDEQGDRPGQFSAPHGMAFDSDGFMYIVDTFNHRVQKFAV